MLSSEGRDSYPCSSCSKGEDNLSLSPSRDNYSTILSVQGERHPYPCQDTAGHELSLPLCVVWDLLARWTWHEYTLFLLSADSYLFPSCQSNRRQSPSLFLERAMPLHFLFRGRTSLSPCLQATIHSSLLFWEEKWAFSLPKKEEDRERREEGREIF